MNVLMLGGTGSIGAAVVHDLLEQHHKVFALARTAEACKTLAQMGAAPLAGDLRNPAAWIEACDKVDAVVQAAATWGPDMGNVDRLAVDAILAQLALAEIPKSFLYTGGCWLYGETGDAVATEASAFASIDSYDYSIPTIEKVLQAENVRGMVIHPAMVYERNGGVFDPIFNDAENLGYVRVVGNENVRWPMIHREDLARLYTLMLEKGEKGDVFNAAANHGVPIGKMTRAIANRLGIYSDPIVCDVKTAMAEMGVWAEGYAIDQQMSGRKARDELAWCPKYEDVFAVIS